jgi:hypothetical protein
MEKLGVNNQEAPARCVFLNLEERLNALQLPQTKAIARYSSCRNLVIKKTGQDFQE